MRIAIVSPDYPCERSNAFAFVHARSKLYREYGNQVEVFVANKSEEDYSFEGIKIHKLNRNRFVSRIDEYKPDVVAVHYPTYKTIPLVKKLNYPLVVWIHGHEILWTFSVMSSKNVFNWIKKRILLLPRETYQILRLRKFLKQVNYCVFVSNWLLNAAKKHAVTNFKNGVVIPNPVDTKLFNYRLPKNRQNGLSVRSLERSIYGLDIAIKAFSQFDKANLTIYGKGRFYKKYSKMILKFRSNVVLKPYYIEHNKLPELYHQYSFFVAPSRRETQGLAMCEAMACGLPVIATNVGGIPEFVRDGIDGFLVPPNNPEKIRKAVLKLISDESKFLEMSKNAREGIKKTCGSENITKRELALLQSAAEKNR